MSELAEFLLIRGYHRVLLRRSLLGHFHTTGTLNSRVVEVMVDTGASVTCVAMSMVQELGLRSEWLNREASGASGTLDQYVVEGAVLKLGSFDVSPDRVAGLDFQQVNAPLVAHGVTAVDVILGADVLGAANAIIDYASMSLYLREIVGMNPFDGRRGRTW